MKKVKLIFVDGPDGAGKTTFINKMAAHYKLVLFKMPKVDRKGSILKVNEYKDFELMKALLVNLDPNKAYIFDRCYLSNMAYDETDSYESVQFRHWLKNSDEVEALELIFTRDHINFDFEDDKIDLSQARFNSIIDSYEQYAKDNGRLEPYKLVNYNEKGEFVGVDLFNMATAETELNIFLNGR